MSDQKPPTASGVYMLFSGARCVYVGSALNLRARLSGHPHTGKFDRWDWFECAPMDLAAREAEMIDLHKPTLNKRRVAGRFSGHKAPNLPIPTGPTVNIPGDRIGEWIDGLRCEGETVEQLALRVGVSRQTLSAVINKRRLPGPNLIKRLRPFGMHGARNIYVVRQ